MPHQKLINVLITSGILLIGLAVVTPAVDGQVENQLILKKRGYVNKMHFLAGDPIKFIREGNKYAEDAYIQGIGIDYILVSNQKLFLKDISHLVKTNTGFNFRGSGKGLMLAAPGYLVIGAINTLFEHRYTGLKAADLVPSRGNLIVAGSLLAAGAILPSFQVRKFRVGSKFTLKVVQTNPFFNGDKK